MEKLRFAVIGTGFWSYYQIAGWLESSEVELVSLCDHNFEKLKSASQHFGIEKIYTDADEMMEKEDLHFVDIITSVHSHLFYAEKAAKYGIHVVCQKPMADTWESSKALVKACNDAGVSVFINENFRWQYAIRKVKELLDESLIGSVFKAKVSFCSAFPVFENQPFLKTIDKFILTDIGSHVLDICRFLFGEASYLFCLTKTVNPEISGEDVANILMEMKNGVHCIVEMSYASILEKEVFPETLLSIEGEKGSLSLQPGNKISVTNRKETKEITFTSESYAWADPDYAIVHNSIVPAQLNIIEGLKGGHAETTGKDNLETVRLIWAAYESAASKRTIRLDKFN